MRNGDKRKDTLMLQYRMLGRQLPRPVTIHDAYFKCIFSIAYVDFCGNVFVEHALVLDTVAEVVA